MKLLVALLVAMELVGSTRGLVDRLYCGKDNCYDSKAHTARCFVLLISHVFFTCSAGHIQRCLSGQCSLKRS